MRVAGLVLWLLAARDARAEGPVEPLEPITLEYSAPAECPSVDHLLRQVRAYTSNWTIAPERPDARHFRLRTEHRGPGYVGRFDVRDEGGATVGREVTGESCDDVALALAITVALAIDPRANLSANPPLTPPRVDEADPPAAVAERDEPVEAPRGSSEDRGRNRSPEPPTRVEATSPRARLAVGSRLEGTTAVSGVLAVFDAFFEVDLERTSERLPWLRPVLRLGLRKSFTRTASLGEARLAIDWTAGQIEICPSRFSLAPSLSVDVCAGSNVGEITATAREIPDAPPTRRLWFDYGGLLALRWQAHPNLFAEITGAMWVPRRRDRLRVEPDGVVSQAPAAGISTGLGLGWRF